MGLPLLAALALAAAAADPAPPVPSPEEQRLVEKFIRRDERFVQELLPLFRAQPEDLAAFRRIGFTLHPQDDRELGLGYRRAVLRRDERFASANVGVIYDRDGHIVRGVIVLFSTPQGWPILEERLHLTTMLGASPQELDGKWLGIVHTFADPGRCTTLRQAFEAHFEIPASGMVVPPELRKDFELLTDPLACDEYWPPGRDDAARAALNRIRAHGSRALLEAIAASPSPEGRMYAVEALLGKAAGPVDVSARLAAIAALGVSVRFCSFGCLDERASTVAALRALLERGAPPSGAVRE